MKQYKYIFVILPLIIFSSLVFTSLVFNLFPTLKTITLSLELFIYLLILMFFIFYFGVLMQKRMLKEAQTKSELYKASKERLRQIFDLVPHLMYIKDEKGNFIDMNQRAMQTYNISADDIERNINQKEVFKNTRQLQKIFETDAIIFNEARQITYIQDVQIQEKNILLTTTKTPFYLDGKTFLLGISIDISHEKELIEQEQIILQEEKALALQEMARAIIHQLKQPLNFLNLHFDVLGMKLANQEFNPQDIQHFNAKAKENIRFMKNTLDGLKDFYGVSYKKEVFELKACVEEFLELFYNHINISQTTLHKELSSTFVYGVRNDFKQVLLNIFNNAEEQFRKNAIKGVIHIQLQKSEKAVFLRISDNAQGIDASLLDTLFQKHASTKKEGGFGLYMAQKIVHDLFCGTITASNTKEGLCLKITLPLAKESYDTP